MKSNFHGMVELGVKATETFFMSRFLRFWGGAFGAFGFCKVVVAMSRRINRVTNRLSTHIPRRRFPNSRAIRQ